MFHGSLPLVLHVNTDTPIICSIVIIIIIIIIITTIVIIIIIITFLTPQPIKLYASPSSNHVHGIHVMYRH